MRPALDHAPHDPRVLEHPEVLGDRGLGHPETAGDLTNGRRAHGEPLDDATADRVRERPERIVNHMVNDSEWSMRATLIVAGATARCGTAGLKLALGASSIGYVASGRWPLAF